MGGGSPKCQYKILMQNSRNIFLVAFIAAVMMTSGGGVLAFESTSASFELHAGDTENITGTSTSASFGEHNAGGQTAVGTSTSASFGDCSGILCWLMGWFTPSYTQIHYRWRNDDGTESTATFYANQDTQYNNFPKNTAKRLRLEVSNKGWTRGAAPAFTLEFAKLASGTDCANGPFATNYVAVPNDYSLEMHLSTTTVADATATSNVNGCSPQSDCLTDENATFVAGQVKTLGNTTAAITLGSDKFTEIEYGVSATSLASASAPYCFRVTNGGSTANMAYSQYAMATLTSGLTFGSLTSSVFDTGVANGAAYNSITWIGALLGGKVRLKIATSNSSSGPWNYVGAPPTCATTDTGDGDWFVIGSDTPTEIKCFSTNNNKRYFRYKVQLCAESTCAASGGGTPRVDDVIISWSP